MSKSYSEHRIQETETPRASHVTPTPPPSPSDTETVVWGSDSDSDDEYLEELFKTDERGNRV